MCFNVNYLWFGFSIGFHRGKNITIYMQVCPASLGWGELFFNLSICYMLRIGQFCIYLCTQQMHQAASELAE